MTSCKGIGGWLFGHEYRPRYSHGAPTVIPKNAHMVFADEMVKVLNATRQSTYHGEVCVRCGSTIAAKFDEGRGT